MTPPRRWSRLALWGLLVAIILWVGSALAVVFWGSRDAAQPADAIVVLGAAQYVGRPSPVLRARLDHALVLWEKGLAPHVILTGGKGIGDTTSEAAVSRRYMIKHGVPDSVILTENAGRTTNESLASVAALMHERHLTRAILVSDPFHMLRLRVTARHLGLTPFTSPTQTSPISANRAEVIEYVLNESVKVPLVWLAGLVGR